MNRPWLLLLATGLIATALLLSGCQLLPGQGLSAELNLRPRPPAEATDALADRVKTRIAALGVSESDVDVRGGLIRVRLRPEDLTKVQDSFRQAPTGFALRPVLASAPREPAEPGPRWIPAGAPIEPPYDLRQVDCAAPPLTDVSPGQAVVLCSRISVLAAGASVMGGEHITKVEMQFENEPVVRISLDQAGAEILESTTKTLAALPPPQNELAMAIHAQVLSVPAVIEAITGGELQVAGSFSVQQARDLARDVELAASLPVDVV